LRRRSLDIPSMLLSVALEGIPRVVPLKADMFWMRIGATIWSVKSMHNSYGIGATVCSLIDSEGGRSRVLTNSLVFSSRRLPADDMFALPPLRNRSRIATLPRESSQSSGGCQVIVGPFLMKSYVGIKLRARRIPVRRCLAISSQPACGEKTTSI
jgi:hypothetical protein